jgi:hypothetical protein
VAITTPAAQELMLDVRVAGFPLRVAWGFAGTMLRLGFAVAVLATLTHVIEPVAAPLTAVLLGLICAVSILLHELGHAAAAARRDVPTDEVRLTAGGGGHHRSLTAPGRTSADDAWISAGGPLATLAVLVVAVAVAVVAGWSLDVPATLRHEVAGSAAGYAHALLLAAVLVNGLALAATLAPYPGSDGRGITDHVNGTPDLGEILVNLPLAAALDGAQLAAAPDATVACVRLILERRPDDRRVAAALDADGRCLGLLTPENLAGSLGPTPIRDLFDTDAAPVGVPGDRRFGEHVAPGGLLADEPLVVVDDGGRLLGLLWMRDLLAATTAIGLDAGLSPRAARRALGADELQAPVRPPSILRIRR